MAEVNKFAAPSGFTERCLFSAMVAIPAIITVLVFSSPVIDVGSTFGEWVREEMDATVAGVFLAM